MFKRVKISLEKDHGYGPFPHIDTLPRKYPLKTSLHNQHMLLEK